MNAIIVAVVALIAAPPLKSVEELPKLLEEELDLLEALDALDQDRSQKEQELIEYRQKRVEMIQRRDDAAVKHQQAQQKLKLQREKIRRRIRVHLELSGIKDWQIAASTGDYSTYLRQRRLLNRLIEDDESRIKEYHKTVTRYRDAEIKLNNELAELERVEQRITTSRTTVERDRAIKAALLESVRSEKAFHIKANRDLSKASKALQKKVDAFELWKGKRLWFRELKGQYVYPLPRGTIARGYGRKVHPRFGTVTVRRGVTLIPGTRRWGGRSKVRRIRAIYTGRIVHSGWLRGYGNTVIIDHSRGDYTLYAHMDKVLVKKGDIVKSNQTVGSLGASGSLKGEGLYFEIRIEGKPVNPVPWFH